MAETTWALLRDLLTDRYTEFKVRLTRRLGSEELASESLHETWLRLHRVIEGSETACVLLGSEPMARSAGGVTVQLGMGTARVVRSRTLEIEQDVRVSLSAAVG